MDQHQEHVSGGSGESENADSSSSQSSLCLEPNEQASSFLNFKEDYLNNQYQDQSFQPENSALVGVRDPQELSPIQQESSAGAQHNLSATYDLLSLKKIEDFNIVAFVLEDLDEELNEEIRKRLRPEEQEHLQYEQYYEEEIGEEERINEIEELRFWQAQEELIRRLEVEEELMDLIDFLEVTEGMTWRSFHSMMSESDSSLISESEDDSSEEIWSF